eukprot:COSAG02_NODE_7520_length_2975_cov_8.611613_5_plen_46_part_00
MADQGGFRVRARRGGEGSAAYAQHATAKAPMTVRRTQHSAQIEND